MKASPITWFGERPVDDATTNETRLRAWAARLAPAAAGTPGAAMAWAVAEIDRLRRAQPAHEAPTPAATP